MSTRFSRTGRIWAAISVPLIFAAATPLTSGMTYEFVMKTQSTRTGNQETVTMRGRGTYAGDQAKIEIVDASAAGESGMFGGKGSYFIMKGGGKEMYLVDPTQKQYMAWDIANMFAGMSKMINAVGGVVKMQMSDVKIDAQDLGAGETVQGYPTRHVRMVQNYTMTASVFGRTTKTSNATTTDYYFAPALKIANPFVSNSQQMSMMSQMDVFNNPDYKTQMMAAQAKIPKNGVPLKMVTTAVATDSKGKQETTTTTMEMLNMKSSNIPESAFAIPSDYKLVQMPTMTPSGGQSGDASSTSPSVNADSAAKAAAADAAKASAKDAAAKKLRGIFKH
jgi:hypothetical protein